jgi:hypothetical protein
MCTRKVPVHSEVGEVVARGIWRNLGEWGLPQGIEGAKRDSFSRVCYNGVGAGGGVTFITFMLG